jgi:DcmR-like sensory protein
MLSWSNLTTACDVNDALRHMDRADYGVHCMIIYPDLNTLRMLYPQYIRKQIEGNNEIVLVNPFYETAASTRLLISQANPNMDVPKREREKSLIVIDSLEEYFGERVDMPYKKKLASYAEKTGRTGISILGDIGAYLYKSKHKDLVDYESSLPLKFDVPMKGFCLYHLKDFEQKQKLIQHHSKTLRILERQSSASTFFEQPLNFVNHVKDGQHIVLFYEEIEYAIKNFFRIYQKRS